MSEFYVASGKHYFYQIKERDGDWYRRTVTPLVSSVVSEPAYYRVREWRQFKGGMVEPFRKDHRQREEPHEWENAKIEHA